MHMVCPAPQTVWQLPDTHAWPTAQARPHIPQCRRSVCVSTHSSPEDDASGAPPSAPPPPHRVSEASHTSEHAPRAQTCPLGQALPHIPQ
jgi:hypothetical protein